MRTYFILNLLPPGGDALTNRLLPLLLASLFLLGGEGKPYLSGHSDDSANITMASLEALVPEGRVLFVDSHLNIDGRRISGKEGCGFIFIDFPTYSYNNETGQLRTYLKPNLTEKTLLILGRGRSHSGDKGSGAGTALEYYDTLDPSVTGLEIVDLARDGTITLQTEEGERSLKPGERYQHVKTLNTTQGDCVMEETQTSSIANWGFINTSQLVFEGSLFGGQAI
jgi:hypothetical protein